jgi:hypothetical protein
MVLGLGYGLSLGLTSPHLLAARAHRGACTVHTGRGDIGRCAGRRTPLDRALALHGVSGDSGSHLGSTLKPGGAVLTLGVFRRSRSVACVRADASPSEVLAEVIVPPNSEGVNLTRGHDAQQHPVKGRVKGRVNDHCRTAAVDRDPLWLFVNHDVTAEGVPVGVCANIDVSPALCRA